MSRTGQLSIPPGVSPHRAGELYQVHYCALAQKARAWAAQHSITLADTDKKRTALLIIDAQVDFCIPGFGLYVNGAEQDNQRLCEFIYRNLGAITRIYATMDTHDSAQIFHPQFWVDGRGQHPAPMTAVTLEDVHSGKWRVNLAMAHNLKLSYEALEAHALHYVSELSRAGRYMLMIWPYHCLLGSLGHALAPAVHEALWFHNQARQAPPGVEAKGSHALTENYSVFQPEILTGPEGRTVAQRNTRFLDTLLGYERILIAGQAKSHCVAWSVDDLLAEINTRNPQMARNVYLLEDCTSPVVVPGVCDFSGEANKAFERFAASGMQIIQSTDSPEQWLP